MEEEKEDQNGVSGSRFNSCEFHEVENVLNAYASTDNGSPKKAVPPLLMECPSLTDDSSDSLCRVDLPNDLLVASPMKISDILSLLLESPEKSSSATHGVSQADLPVINDAGLYLNDMPPMAQSVDAIRPLRRSYSWHDQDSVRQRLGEHSIDTVLDKHGHALLRRSKSLDNYSAWKNYEPLTTSFSQSWFPSISSAVNNTALDVITDLLREPSKPEMHESVPEEVSILGYSLPLVPVDGVSMPFVCATDVFQTFFSTRHWDEFKTILEKNSIQCISTMVASNVNSFGVPEVVDVIGVKDVESLLLSNQARKDGFVRCLRLSTNDGGTNSADSTAPSSTDSVVAESKIVMMPERHVGELSSGIRTRHGDQSDILYVEVDGYTLPSIVLNGGVQYVRLVDVRQKFSTTTAGEEKQIGDKPVSLAMQLQTLKNACTRLNIDVRKCRPNEKARMVVYANSCHSNSLHIIDAQQLPRLIEYTRRENKRRGKKCQELSGPDSLDHSPFSGNLHVAVSEHDASSTSWNASTPGSTSLISPLSRPSSVDSGDSGTSSGFTPFTMPPSPISGKRSSKYVPGERRASLNGPLQTSEAKKRRTDKFPSYLNDPYAANMKQPKMETTGNSPMSIWQNGNLKEYSTSGEDPVSAGHSTEGSGHSIEQSGQCTQVTEKVDSGACSTSKMTVQDVNFVVNSAYDLDLGRDEDKLIDVLTPQDAIAPCRIVVDNSSPLPVAVYNRRGCRGPAGKYYDHLFVSKNAACIWCYGCAEFFSLADFLVHGHDNTPSVPNPQLFMWVSALKDANLQLWGSLLNKAKAYGLDRLLNYRLPDNFDYTGEDEVDGEGSSNKTTKDPGPASNLKNDDIGTKHIVVGPTPPLPLFRRRPPRGDAYSDVLERFSAPAHTSLSPTIVGLYSQRRERAIDEAYKC